MRWTFTTDAIRHYRRVRREMCTSDANAEAELGALAPSAVYRQSHDNGRQLWRSGRPLQLRWVVEGLRVLWVGQGRPPQHLWPR
jgi:hypothetical protein